MDKSQAKKYTKIAVTLGVIAGGSALLIGLANLITVGPIKQHELEKKLESVKVVYGENATYSDEIVIADEHKEAYPRLVSYFNAKDANGTELGNVFVTSGANSYGSIKMSIGINADSTFGKIFLIENGQSFASTLQTEFVDKYNASERDFDDLKCGATFGATLINEMGKEARAYYKTIIKGEGEIETRDFLANIYGENSIYGEEVKVDDDNFHEIQSYYTASSKNGVLLGYVFVLSGQNEYGGLKISIGINADATLGRVFIIENGQTNGKDKVVQEEYVDKYNNKEIEFDDVTCGATVGAKLINNMGKEAVKYVKSEILHEVVDFEPLCKEIFGKDAKYTRHQLISEKRKPTLKEMWEARSADEKETLGRVYHADVEKMQLMIGINKAKADGKQTLKKVFWVNPTDDADAKAFIEKVNAGTADITIKDNDVASIKNIKTAIKEATFHAEANKINDPFNAEPLINKIFGDQNYVERTAVNDVQFPSVIEYWNVKDASGKYIGRVYHNEMYTADYTVHTVSGVDLAGLFTKVTSNIIDDGSDAYKEYKAYENGINDKTIDLYNYSAANTTLTRAVRQLSIDGELHYAAFIIFDQYLVHSYGETASYIEPEEIHDVNYGNLRKFWNVKDTEGKYLGRVYHCALEGKHGVMHTATAVNVDGTFHNIFLINRAPGQFGDKLERYIEALNRGDISLEDDVHTGATGSTDGARDLARLAIEHYKANPLKGE